MIKTYRIDGLFEYGRWPIHLAYGASRWCPALREGMREGFTLGQYLMLVDYTSRLVRDGKAAVTAEVESIFTRLCFVLRTSRFCGTKLVVPGVKLSSFNFNRSE